MGQSSSYSCEPPGVTFPTSNSISATQAHALAISNFKNTIVTAVSAPIEVIPVVGSFIPHILIFLSSIDTNGLEQAYVDARIDEKIYKDSMSKFRAEILTIKDSLEGLTRLTKPEQYTAKLEYSIARSNYLLHLYNDTTNVFWIYPMASMENYIKLTNFYESILVLTRILAPELAPATNDKIKGQINRFVNNFMAKQTGGIKGVKCQSGRPGYVYKHIYDIPWRDEKKEDYWSWKAWKTVNTKACKAYYGPTNAEYDSASEYIDVVKRLFKNYFTTVFPADYIS